jgi:HD-GYP domain-containing protein (c-di-GMP phosphodiesterase class II)
MDNSSATARLFFKTFFKLIQLVKLHTDSNSSVAKSLDEFSRVVERVAATEKFIKINLSEGRLYFQEEKVAINRENQSVFKLLIEFFEKRKISGIEIVPELALRRRDEILQFFRALNSSENQEEAAAWIEERIAALNIEWVEILKENHSGNEVGEPPQGVQDEALSDTDGPGQAFKESAKNAYANSLYSLKEISDKAISEKPTGVRKVLRIVQGMIDLVLEDEFVFLGLSTIRDYDDYTYVHSVNVAILSMSLGARIGLGRDELEALGMCGVFHDLGKIKVPIELINKKDKLNSKEYDAVKAHSLESVRMILWMRASRDLLQKIVLGPFEHHLKCDLSGYPKTDRRQPLSLYGRILTIADVYDALTSPRIYRRTTISPDQALNMMTNDFGNTFDPLLLKMFVNMLGIYPIGSLLKLSSGELGLVARSSENKDPLRPRVVLIKKRPNNGYEKGATIDLSEKNPATGGYSRDILRSYHPSVLGIQPAEYLV